MAVVEYEEFGPVRRWRVSRTLLGRPVFWVSFFLVDGLVLDAGPTVAWPVVEAALASHAIRQVVLTHHHEDHSGNAGRLAERFRCPVHAPADALPLLEHGDIPLTWYRRYVWGLPAPVRALPLGSELATERHRFRVLPTPGHSPDHVCLYEPREGWLFTGDVFLHDRIKMMRWDEDLPGEVASLESLLALPRARLFCGHYPRVVEDHREAIAAKLAHLRGLRERARELAGRGEAVGGIRRRLLGREEGVAYLSRGNLSKRNLVEKLLAWQASPEDGTPAARPVADGRAGPVA
ncbi:MAG: MBL fold metallo-hydrolase [Planctomycetes bacterium]|nr:MBL fold metallo-hydrolase [Planctomycetota bacterium]